MKTNYPNNILLLNKNSGADKNLFFIHDGTGRIDSYFNLSELIHPNFNVYGVAFDQVKINLAPMKIKIQDIARKYIKQLKKIQDHGPYFIAGWSSGGTITFEMASQLEKEEQIEFCALIDTVSPRYYDLNKEKYTEGFSLESEIEFICRFIKDDSLNRQLRNCSNINQFWRLIISKLKEDDFNKKLFMKEDNWLEIISNYNNMSLNQFFYTVNLIRTIYNACLRYYPDENIKTGVHMFSAVNSKINVNNWYQYCCNLKSYQVSGNHFSIFSGDNIKSFSDKFNKVITNS